jgi:hypothetical protein
MANIKVKPLITGAIVIAVLLILRVVLPLVLSPAAGQIASFMTIFLSILMAFIFFGVAFPAANLSGKIPPKLYRPIEAILIAGIVLGVIGMFQPWAHILYRIGFHLLLFSVLGFTAWSHITPRRQRQSVHPVGVPAGELEKGS